MMDMMEYRHKAMAYLGPLPAFSTLAGEEEMVINTKKIIHMSIKEVTE